MILTKNLKREIDLLERHIKIVKLLSQGPIGIVRLSHITNIPVHQVRYSLRILQMSGLIKPTTKGAMLSEKGKKFLVSVEKEKKNILKNIQKL